MTLPRASTPGPTVNALTDQAHWNGVWRGLGHPRRIKPWDHGFGRFGEFIRLMNRWVGKLEAPRVLELGGACSYRALALARWWNASVSILDYSPTGIEWTHELFTLNGCDVELICADFSDVIAAAKYDIVMHFGVLEHFTTPDSLLGLSAGLLAPRGALVFTMPNMEAIGAHFWRLWSPADWRRHIYHSDEEITRACGEIGLELSGVFHFGPPMLQMSPWERRSWLPWGMTMLQRGINGIWRFPLLALLGGRSVSMYRGFVARKHERDSTGDSG